MEVSVIITTFRNPKRLEKAIRTVQNQTFQKYEIIIVDGANSESCKRIAKKYAVVFHGLKEDLSHPFGVQRSRNAGIKIAIGKYIAFLDDDDEWLPRKLELQYAELEKGADFVSCNTLVRYNGKEFVDKKIKSPTFEDFLKGFAISSTSSIIAKKEVLQKTGGWNEKVRGMHEYDIALRVARLNYKIVNVQLPLMIKNQGFSAQIGTVYWKIAEMFEFLRLYRKDILEIIGWKGYIFNIIKMWLQITIYSFTFIIGDRIWKILYYIRIKGGFGNDKDKRKYKAVSQSVSN